MAMVNDEAFVAGAADGQVGGAFGALRVLDDPLPERIERRRRARSLESELDIGGFDFAAGWRGGGGSGTGSGKPEGGGIQRQKTGRRSGGVAELETEFDGSDLGRRARQQFAKELGSECRAALLPGNRA